MRFLITFLLAILLTCCGNPADRVQSALRGGAVVELPAGELHLTHPLVIPKGSKDVVIQGAKGGSTIVLDPGFEGRAAIEADGVSNTFFRNFSIVGDRREMKSFWYLPLKEAAFADYYTANGIVIRNGTSVGIRGVTFSRIRAFPIILNATAGSVIDSVTIQDCGTLNQDGHNNTTGGILIEEGSKDFEISNSTINRIPGNAIWTHSYARSPRQDTGRIRDNVISTVARDAIQIGHATRVRVENNRGSDIGFPVDYVDFPGYGTPVALDTAGNVDHTVYTGNSFTRVAGQCIDLDGFHDGEVTGNQCINGSAARNWIGLHFAILFGNHDPGMTSSNIVLTGNTLQGFAYGGIFLIGDHNRIESNRFVNVTLAGCGTKAAIPAKCGALPDEPDALRSGIYLADNGGRPAVTRDNVIHNNAFTGIDDARHCIAAKPGVSLAASTITGNLCPLQ